MCWRDIKDEPKIDMNYVALIADEYVPIVTILDLQNVTDHTVGSLTLDEVLSRHLEVHRIG